MDNEIILHKQENNKPNDEHSIQTVPPQAVIFSREPKKALVEMQELVQMMSSQCTGSEFIAEIKGKQYPKVEWWTTLGATIGLFPVVVYSRRLDRKDEVAYESRVEVRLGDRVVAAGEALCTSDEPNWKNSPEYSIKSMSITRATGKAYRIPLSFIAVMAGLAPTNAEEMMNLNISEKSTASFIPATSKQKSYIYLICEYPYGEESEKRILQHIHIKYGISSLEEMSKNQASEMIEYLLAKNELLTS